MASPKACTAFDESGPKAMTSFPVDTNATKGWTLIRDGLDLHEIGNNLRNWHEQWAGVAERGI
jgi:hypothetical protein